MAEAKDPFAELKKAPYAVFVAPRPYSFDLNEDMVNMIRSEFGAESVADKLTEAIVDMPKATAADGYCEFSMRKL